MELVAIAAVSENGVIGHKGELPWNSIPADKQQYRQRVAHAPVVLGRVTYESMQSDLPGTMRVVLTRTNDISLRGKDLAVGTVSEALERLVELDAERAYVLGGGQVYASFLPYLDRLLISRVPGHYEGDTRFPPIDPNDWQLEDETTMPGFTLESWVRT